MPLKLALRTFLPSASIFPFSVFFLLFWASHWSDGVPCLSRLFSVGSFSVIIVSIRFAVASVSFSRQQFFLVWLIHKKEEPEAFSHPTEKRFYFGCSQEPIKHPQSQLIFFPAWQRQWSHMEQDSKIFQSHIFENGLWIVFALRLCYTVSLARN